jgi:hypothetical protein
VDDLKLLGRNENDLQNIIIIIMQILRFGWLLHPRRSSESENFQTCSGSSGPLTGTLRGGPDYFRPKLTGTFWDLNHCGIASLLIAPFHTLR